MADLTTAVEVAAKGIYDQWRTGFPETLVKSWEDVDGLTKERNRDYVLPAVLALNEAGLLK